MIPFETQTLIANLRQRIAQGESVSTEEYAKAIILMREGRVSAAHASEASRKKKAATVVVDVDDLLSEAEGM